MTQEKMRIRLTRALTGRPVKARHNPLIETLEIRAMLSGNPAEFNATPAFVLGRPPSLHGGSSSPSLAPFATLASAPFNPTQIRGAYGINAISFGGVAGDGSGQTIAIVDAYNDPNVTADLATFNTQWGLPQFNSGGPTFKVANQNGLASPLPANSTAGGWDIEEALDVEWAHAVAPKANIILFEANTAGGDLYTAVATAAGTAGVSVVSMSWGGSEFGGESSYDSYFTTPSGHQGVTFLASTGDSGSPGGYPAYSPNVVAVGGTSLGINTDNTWGSETGWSGSGGGISTTESQPSYQVGKVNGLTSTRRATPDVSMDADSNTGVYVYDSYAGGWYQVGGTSLSAPMWGGLIAIANQGRVLSGGTTLQGQTQTLPALYNLNSSDFHDITSGSNGAFSAAAGYDLVTGLGAPIANTLVPHLASYAINTTTAAKLGFSVQPANATAGATLSTVTVQIQDAAGNLVATDNSAVTLSLASGSGTLTGTVTVNAVNGVATFNNLKITTAGVKTLKATDGTLTLATSASFTISAAAASKLAFTTQPANATAGNLISPSVVVAVQDAFGNLVTTNSSTVSLSVSTGALTGTTAVAAVNGVATFSTLKLTTAGSYRLAATDAALTSATSNSFTISAAAASALLFHVQPSNVVHGATISPSVVVYIVDAYGNLVTNDNSKVTLSVFSGPGSISGTKTVKASKGVATFSNLSISTLGTYVLQATDGSFTKGALKFVHGVVIAERLA